MDALASTSWATAAPPASATAARCPSRVSEAINGNDLVAVSVLSGNRNFEGRVSPTCAPIISPRRRWWSPMRWAPCRSTSPTSRWEAPTVRRVPARHLAEQREVASAGRRAPEMFGALRHVFEGDSAGRHPRSRRRTLPCGTVLDLRAEPAYFEGMTMTRRGCGDSRRARAGRCLGDSITHRPHLARRLRSRPTARPAAICWQIRSPRRVQQLLARAAATMK
jgi:aconitate hydratase